MCNHADIINQNLCCQNLNIVNREDMQFSYFLKTIFHIILTIPLCAYNSNKF